LNGAYLIRKKRNPFIVAEKLDSNAGNEGNLKVIILFCAPSEYTNYAAFYRPPN